MSGVMPMSPGLAAAVNAAADEQQAILRLEMACQIVGKNFETILSEVRADADRNQDRRPWSRSALAIAASMRGQALLRRPPQENP